MQTGMGGVMALLRVVACMHKRRRKGKRKNPDPGKNVYVTFF